MHVKIDHDAGLLNILDDLCKNVCVYGAAELFNSLAACKKFKSEMKAFSFPEASKLVDEMHDKSRKSIQRRNQTKSKQINRNGVRDWQASSHRVVACGTYGFICTHDSCLHENPCKKK